MANDSWMYQGRQHHMWFGHGTKPTDPKSAAPAGDLIQRIGAIGHALPAALPTSRRSHPAARLGPDDHARLARVLSAAVRALPTGANGVAANVLGRHPQAPGIASFVEAARLVQAASTPAKLRPATEKLAQSAQEMGLDQFKPFLRQADQHRADQQAIAQTTSARASTKGSARQTAEPASRAKDGAVASPDSQTPSPADGPYSPSEPGFHRYSTGPNVVCPAELRCSPEEIADQLARFSVPGQRPEQLVKDGQRYVVYDPTTGLEVGIIRTKVSPDGLTIQNMTTPLHILYNGQVTRTATQNPDGSWSVTSIGVGNNVIPEMNKVNEDVGPGIFRSLDEQMRRNIERHHGVP